MSDVVDHGGGDLGRRKTVVAASAEEARRWLTNALDAERVGEISGERSVRVARWGVLITIFYDTDNESGPPQPGAMPASLHVDADVLRELLVCSQRKPTLLCHSEERMR